MVWAAEQMVVHVRVDCGAECAHVPVRVKLEYEVQDGLFTPDTLSFGLLCNRNLLEKRYPQLDLSEVELAMRETVQSAILSDLRATGFLRGSGTTNERES
jgi:hypothetical protein